MSAPISKADRDVYRRWIERARREPDFFAYEVFGRKLWSHQTDALLAWKNNRRTSWRSCNGIGKSTDAGVGVWWLGSLWEEILVLTTATKFTQVLGQVWTEIAQLQQDAKIPLGAKLLTAEIRWPHKSKATGLTAPPKDVTKMQGFRGRRGTYILGDEAGGLSPAILEGINSMLTGDNAHLLLQGNPTDPTSEFRRTFDRSGVEKIHTSAWDSPNFVAFGITRDDYVRGTWRAKITGPLPFPALITPQWVADLYEQVGGNMNDPRWQARVEGNFPTGDLSGIVPRHWYEAAVKLGKLKPEERAEIEEYTGKWSDDVRRAGCDVGRSEDGDPSIISGRRGIFARSAMRVLQGANSIKVAADLRDVLGELGPESEANIDAGGIGAGVVDQARMLNLAVTECLFGSSPRNSERFLNFRAEEYWNLRERFRASYRASLDEPVAPGIVLEEGDEFLAEELAAIRWSEDARGRIVLEPKEETKKRLPGGRSPDRADALMLTFATGRAPLVFL